MKSKLIQTRWRKLIMVNYAVDQILIEPYLPAKTEIDLWQGRCYLSLVGFMFLNTRVKGIHVPFHSKFEEINLRFYVRRKNMAGQWKKGVVFLKELVSKPLLTLVANTFFREKYETVPMENSIVNGGDFVDIEYRFQMKKWYSLKAKVKNELHSIDPGTEEEFLTEREWGYSKINEEKTFEYQVKHPLWFKYPIEEFNVDVDFSELNGGVFNFLNHSKPVSVLVTEGSEVEMWFGNTL